MITVKKMKKKKKKRKKVIDIPFNPKFPFRFRFLSDR